MGNYMRDLFQLEKEWIIRGRALLQSTAGQSQLSREEYEKLLNAYSKLFRWTTKIFSISDRQGMSLKQREAELQSLLHYAGQGFLLFGPDRKVRKEYSHECARLFGRRIGGADVADLLFESSVAEKAPFIQSIADYFEAADPNPLLEEWASSSSGKTTLHNQILEWELKPFGDEQQEERLLMLILTDVTDKLLYEAKAHRMSCTDSLTGMYNRTYAEGWMASSSQSADLFPLSILYTDINGLKLMNDVFGHDQGDSLLQRAADLLLSKLRESDIAVRWGGDELLLLMPRTDEMECRRMAEQLYELCSQSEAAPICISMAIGTATGTEPSQDWKPWFLLAEKRMYKEKLMSSRAVHTRMLKDLERLLENKQWHDKASSKRLKRIALKLAAQAGIKSDSQEMQTLVRLSEIHNMGMVTLPDQLVAKAETLSQEEWEILQTHSEIGYRLAKAMGEPVLAEAVLAMHERWDGTGYPFGLKGEHIPYTARLLAIADAYVAMTRHRVFRPHRSNAEALMEIQRGAGSQFDPALARLFVRQADRITL